MKGILISSIDVPNKGQSKVVVLQTDYNGVTTANFGGEVKVIDISTASIDKLIDLADSVRQMPDAEFNAWFWQIIDYLRIFQN